jgi:hypothetical protein
LATFPDWLAMYERASCARSVWLRPTRHPALPDVRTFEEQGLKGIDTNNWYALFVLSKTPPDLVESLNKAVRALLTTSEVRAKLKAMGAEPVPSTPAELAAILKADTEKWLLRNCRLSLRFSSNGRVEMGHTAAYFYIGKDTAFTFGTTLPWMAVSRPIFPSRAATNPSTLFPDTATGSP